MNLNNSPTLQDLSTTFAACNDNAGHHVLWVSHSGDVTLTQLVQLSPVGFEKATPSMAMHYETFQQGNGYVGQNAANDLVFMDQVLRDLINSWANYSGIGIKYIG
jgi:hypothetical protein